MTIPRSGGWVEHADDGFLPRYRKMHDFPLSKTHSMKRNGDELPDILALDYLPSGYVPTWTLLTWTRDWHEAINKQLAHLTYEREKSWDHRRLVPRLEKGFLDARRLFLQDTDQHYKKEFAEQNRALPTQTSFAGIKL